MAKGDYIEVRIATGDGVTTTATLTASKAGRRVKRRDFTMNKNRWLELSEVNRNGGETGIKLTVLMDRVVTIAEVASSEDDDVPAKVARPKATVDADQLALDAEPPA